MLFKDELPPLRYALDGDLEDQEVFTEKKFELSIPKDIDPSPIVLLLAPRCAPLAADFGGTLSGNAVLTVTSTPRMNRHELTSDFYEVEASAEDFTSKQQWTVPVLKTVHNLTIILLPAAAEAESAALGSELIKQLKPLQVVLATPGLTFGESEISFISTQNYTHRERLEGLPRASPPSIVQGAGAAAISRAQQLGIPALALVVSADGPANHEIMPDTGLKHLSEAVFRALGLKLVSGKQVESSLSVLYV